ncbi:MAG: energy transducer TonB [Flavobacteriaceae bacterium]|nr:energy transducer TonB [Flavobacteriaceae bacterium]
MELKKNPKVNLSRWSNIFFLTGLAIMLFLSWQAIELKTYDKGNIASEFVNVGDDLEKEIPITQQLNPPPPPPPRPPTSTPQVIEVVEDDLEIEESIIESSEADQNSDISDIVEIEEIEEVEEEEIVDVPFAVIEDVPIYPGCESKTNNDARKQCMADNIMNFVQQKFNTELASELGLEGRQRISVQFKIDRYGDVVNVRARAPHPRLEQEAIKVVQSLPKMTPGKQRGKPVGVLYALPILFKVENGG